MKKDSIFDKTKKILKSELETKKTLTDSKRWFKEQMNTIMFSGYRVAGLNQTPSKFYTAKQKARIFNASEIKFGNLYCWYYDPKHKLTLPYYDTFPVTFIVDFYSDGFLGINLHYLPIRPRAILMTRLVENMLKTNSKGKYLDLQYQTLKGASQYKEFKPCIKRYLLSHIKGQMVQIEPEEWIKTVFLPLESFKKKTKYQVWNESKKIIKA